MKKILIADDDSAIVDATSILLEDEGYAMLSTTDGKEVVAIAKENHPDVILLDIWMSGTDGKDVCKTLKESNETKDIHIIMFSANRDTEKIAKDAGADDYLTKPFDIEELLNKIKQFT